MSLISIVEKAVLNNISWCKHVCETHGITYHTKENICGLSSKAPTFYPEIITANSRATSGVVNEFNGKGKVLSVKDSFANLDLSAFGFDILFEAEWIFHEPVPNDKPFPSTWRVVTTKDELAIWASSCDLENVIRPELLKKADVKIFIYEKDGGISGFIAGCCWNIECLFERSLA